MKDKSAGYVPFPDFETLEECESRRLERIRKLRRMGGKYRDIAKDLELHDDEIPCQHPACPVCMREWRSTFIRNGAHFIREEWEGEQGEIGLLVYVPPRSELKESRLHKLDLRGFKERVAKHFSRAGWDDVSLIGGVDISWNECSYASFEGYWSPHLQAVCHFPSGMEKAEKQLVDYIKRRRSIGDRLVFLEPVKNGPTDLERALGYCFKSYYDRRVSYTEDDGTHNIRKVSLKPKRELETIRLVHRHSRHSRIFTSGLKRRGLAFTSVGTSKSKKLNFDR